MGLIRQMVCFVPLILYCGFAADDMDAPQLPKESDVRRIEVEIYNSVSALPDIALREIDVKEAGRLLSRIAPLELDSRPDFSLREIGSVKFTLDRGEVVRLTWFWSGKSILKYSLRGARVYHKSMSETVTDEALGLEGVIREIIEREEEGRTKGTGP